MDDVSGVKSVRCGVFSNSASVPSSVSSRHLTPLFSSFPGDFFLGVKETPFLAATAFRRFGDSRAGEPEALEAMARGGGRTGLNGDIPTCFLRFGVPDRVGGNVSVGMRLPSGLMICDVTILHPVNILRSMFFAASTASSSLIAMMLCIAAIVSK